MPVRHIFALCGRWGKYDYLQKCPRVPESAYEYKQGHTTT